MKDVFAKSTMELLIHLKNYCKKQFCLKTPQVLATGMFGVYKGISPNIMTEDSPLSYPLNYDLKHQKEHFSTRAVKSVYYGIEQLSFLGPKIWKLVPAQ